MNNLRIVVHSDRELTEVIDRLDEFIQMYIENIYLDADRRIALLETFSKLEEQSNFGSTYNSEHILDVYTKFSYRKDKFSIVLRLIARLRIEDCNNKGALEYSSVFDEFLLPFVIIQETKYDKQLIKTFDDDKYPKEIRELGLEVTNGILLYVFMIIP